MDVAAYLSRIGCSGPLVPSLETLLCVHRSHVSTVPFENLTLHSGGKVKLDLPWLYEKIVVQRRGGFCYETNGLFSWLLSQLGFSVTVLAGQVMNRFTHLYGPPFDHFIIMVTLEGQRWLCDVGFGACFELPLSLDTDGLQKQNHGVFRVRQQGEFFFLETKAEEQGEKRAGSGDWLELYKFTFTPRKFDDFRDMCEYHQTSPNSLFYCKSLCSLLLPHGRITYIGYKLVSTSYPTEAGQDIMKNETELSEEEIPRVLNEKFGIVLPAPLLPKDDDILIKKYH
uniref:arylamine N-acetyltransferase n=1 Tax=Denticeps clupeoides TaxID=299321 RepID=A0AAY4AC18_9TELE